MTQKLYDDSNWREDYKQYTSNKKHLELLENGPHSLSQAWLLGALHNEWKKIKGYDKNFFLYYEDNDYFTKCNALNMKLYQVTNSFIFHKKIKKMKKNSLNLHSTSFSNINEKNSTYLVGGWHGQWSKFYFLRKYNGYWIAILMCLPNILMNIIQIVPYFFIDPTKAKYKYYKVEGFVCSLIGMSSFKRSIFDKKYILKD